MSGCLNDYPNMGSDKITMNISTYWQWPKDLNIVNVMNLSKYPLKDTVYFSCVLAFAVFMITKQPYIAAASLALFLGLQGGKIVAIAVLFAVYAHKKNNMLALAAAIGAAYFAAGGRF